MRKIANKEYYFQQKLILDITEIIAETMQKKRITKKALAKKMKISQKSITQFLEGIGDMSLRTAVDIMVAMNCCFDIKGRQIKKSELIFNLFEELD